MVAAERGEEWASGAEPAGAERLARHKA